MDNLDDAENNAKVSDSAYSNSCSNSQSRRSHSSKSTHSGSHSSGSSGYGGKPSTSDYSANKLGQPPEKKIKEKDSKKKKVAPVKTTTEVKNESDDAATVQEPVVQSPADTKDEAMPSQSALAQKAETVEKMETTIGGCRMSCKDEPHILDGFSCVVSMRDGVVIYTTPSLTASLGFPKHLWIGRSFIDFVHPRVVAQKFLTSMGCSDVHDEYTDSQDRSILASQITRGLAVPKIVNGMQEKDFDANVRGVTLVCRIRKYRGLTGGFGVKERVATFVPYLLKLSFRNVTDEEGKITYLVIQAKQFTSAFKAPYEKITNAVPFVIRHSANGALEHMDPEAVPYLGYLPQDLADQDALQLYHCDDLIYLKQIYETIVKEGGVPRSDPYRMLTQNGDYLKVETEWSSFINPWSRKLEFVVGKHHVVEGPLLPDVFKVLNTIVIKTEEEKAKSKAFRETIIRIMNEVLTKPAEAAKSLMSSRCQDVATFMESMIEEEPKIDEELQLEIHDPDQGYFRDSVMLGGISPHHEYDDSKSSTETPLSYNQLNYNDNLQRYFDGHLPFTYEDYNTVTEENVLELKDLKPIGPRACISPVAQHSAVDSGDSINCESIGFARSASPADSLGDYQAPRLTEILLNKHNLEMEKELMKIHRVNRCSSKGEREKASETRQKKKEHLARCNTPFHVSPEPLGNETQPAHGVKRQSKRSQLDEASRKHQCTSPRNSQRCQPTSTTPAVMTSTVTTTVGQAPASSTWPSSPSNGTNSFLLGFGFPQQQQIPIMNPVSAMPGMFPLYYTPGPMATVMSTGTMPSPATSMQAQQYQQPMMQCVMYGQAVCGSPFMYSPMGPAPQPQQPYSLQENLMAQTLKFSNSIHYQNNNNKPRGLKPSKETVEKQCGTQNFHQSSDDVSCQTAYSNKSGEAMPESRSLQNPKAGRSTDETVDRDKTDGESSYSSFYSSFFKTDSGSAEDSGDLKKHKQANVKSMDSYRIPQPVKKVVRRKTEPGWMEKVCVTSELVYKYQISNKTLDEVLTADKDQFTTIAQPSLVNEQLNQLYLDLQLEGVAARLTLEEGITSSSSSSEDSTSKKVRVLRRKREYSKLAMVYEEDAPFPATSSSEEAADEPVHSTS